MKSVRIFDEKTQEETGIELVAQQIESINKTLEKINSSTRVTRKLIVALIQDDTKIGKSQIELVLDSLEGLDKRYLKQRKTK